MISDGSRDRDAVDTKSAPSLDQRGCDQRLLQWLSITTSADADHALTRLLEDVARPVIDGIMGRKFGGDTRSPDAEDIASEARCQFVHYLHNLRANMAAGGELPVLDLPAYIATLA